MSEQHQIRFEDGASYETYMGVWSRKVGGQFLDWLNPAPGLSWLDVGAGNGAFTALLADRVKPASILGVDPSPAQLDYARKRTDVGAARFVQGHAMELPANDASADAAVMALVIAFVPDPAKGVAEMVRAVKPGGHVSAYMWDWPEGFPFYSLEQVIAARGLPVVAPPSADASRLQAMHALWQGAGLANVESRVITVERTFPDFDRFWAIALTGPRMSAQAAQLSPEILATLRAGLKTLLGAEDAKPVTLKATANAVKGLVPG
ncbi:methyltransferase domain-containing protein [Aestuariivirga sp.]|uniref:class I SAM-dependent methyltransferase n=1 Tax=Aestuariivirga sp. TaxID=2650926 RepID=UPI0025B9CC73|nr:methyltransferase domain-containing protein [Aestuariivirga sp.]MCA3555474.1 methyltransferase domain-containing protein [Aestuariivirga sp.]